MFQRSEEKAAITTGDKPTTDYIPYSRRPGRITTVDVQPTPKDG